MVEDAEKLLKDIDVSGLTPECVDEVASPARDAVNQHVQTADAWTECHLDALGAAAEGLGDVLKCTDKDVDKIIQPAWERTEALTDQASDALEELNP